VLDSLSDKVLDWKVWLILLVWVLGGLMLIGIIRAVLCPYTRRCITMCYVLGTFKGLIAAAGALGAAWLLYKKEEFEAFVGETTILVVLISASSMLTFIIIAIFAVCKRKTCVLMTCFWLLLLLAIILVLATLLVIYWIYSLGGVPNDAVKSVMGGAEVCPSRPISPNLPRYCAVHASCPSCAPRLTLRPPSAGKRRQLPAEVPHRPHRRRRGPHLQDLRDVLPRPVPRRRRHGARRHP